MADRCRVAPRTGSCCGPRCAASTSYRTSFVIDLVGQRRLVPSDRRARRAGRLPGDPDPRRVQPRRGAGDVRPLGTAFALADLAVGNIERIRPTCGPGTAGRGAGAAAVGARRSCCRRLRRSAGWPGWWSARRVLVRRRCPLRRHRLDAGPGAARGGRAVAGRCSSRSVFVATATVAFWWIDSGEFANGFTYGGRDFTSYPITVYSGLFRRLFAYGLGFAFVAYYPALALLGRPDPLGLPGWVGWASPAGRGCVAAGRRGGRWRTGVRHYRSTGS